MADSGERSKLPVIPALDGFRAYAILGVVFLHVLGMAGARGEGAAWGVVVWGAFGGILDVFFIVTGFLLFLPIVARGGELGGLGRYALARAARLMPAYWLCLVVCLVLLALFPPDGVRDYLGSASLPSFQDIAIHFAGLQMPARMLNPGLLNGFGVNGALWMISILIGFYVLLPLVARRYYLHPVAGLLIAAAITIGWKELAIHTGFFEWIEGGNTAAWVVELIASDQLPGWLFSFALGMTGAWGYLRLQRSQVPRARIERTAIWFAGAGLVAVLVCAYLYGIRAADASGAVGGSTARSVPLLSVAYSLSRGVLIAAIVLGPLWMQRPFAGRLQTFLGERAYGIYLIHIPAGIFVGDLLLGLPRTGSLPDAALWLAVVIAISLAYAELSLRWVERPARRWARRVQRPPKRQGPPVSVAHPRAATEIRA